MVLLFSLVTTQLPGTDDVFVGKTFMPRDNSDLESNGRNVSAELIGRPFFIRNRVGDLLDVGGAWVDKASVLTIKESITYYSLMISHERDSTWALRHRAISYAVSGDIEAALSDVRAALRMSPKSSYLRKTLGDMLFFKEDFSAALEEYDTAIEFSPKYALAHLNRGLCLESMGNIEEAIEAFSNAIQHNPRCAPAFANRSLLRRRQLQLSLALQDMDVAIQIDPHYPVYMHNRALRNADMGRFDRAIKDLGAAIKMVPCDCDHYLERARIFNRLELYDKAISDCNKSIEQNPKCEVATTLRGHLWFAKGETTKARRDWERALQLNPLYIDCLEFLAMELSCSLDPKLRDGPRAIELAKMACELTKWQAFSPLEALAAGYAEVGDFENAVRYEEEAFKVASQYWKSSLKIRFDRVRAREWESALTGQTTYLIQPDEVESARRLCEESDWKRITRIVKLADLALEAGQFQEAISWYEKAYQQQASIFGRVFEGRLKCYRDKKTLRDIPEFGVAAKTGYE